MTLGTGTRIGTYEVTGVLGAGGMGEVYRARDLRLRRDVALKVVPTAFATDGDRLARVRREALVLAALNHPNIGQIYGLEEDASAPVLVLELIDGPTLADRIADPGRGLPMGLALTIAAGIARALDAAHQQGIVHRDLKPSNVKVNDDGAVKVLDFGLAKALEAPEGDEAAALPTVTSPAQTRRGAILGTAAYMAPEQARGKAVDKRADIWAFGCVLYEMLAGRRTFDAETVSDTIAAVLTREPAWTALPAATPDSIQRLLRRCLEKDPRRRLRDIGDALIDLDEPGGASGPEPPANGSTSRRGLTALAGAAVVLIAGAAAAGWYVGHRTAPAAAVVVRQFDLSAPSLKNSASALALSPDGTRIAYVAGAYEAAQIYVRAFDDPVARRLEGTLGANQVFFSPDGQWLGFSVAGGTIKKIPADGGPVATLCVSCGLHGATWTPDGAIIFGASAGGLSRMTADGGAIESITTPAADKNEIRHSWPQVLPGGTAVLFTVLTSTAEGYRVAAVSLKTKTIRVVVETGASGRYVSSGHLVYVRGNTLMAAPFDPNQLTLTGRAVAVLEGVATMPGIGNARFDAALDGTLAFVKVAASDRRTLVWVNRQGGVPTPIAASPRAFWHLSLSPDGTRLLTGDNAFRHDVGLYQFSTGAFTPLTSDGINDFPEWSPEGKTVLFTTSEGALHTVRGQPGDGSRASEVLYSTDHALWVGSITGDQHTLILMESNRSTGGDISRVDLTGDRKTPTRVIGTPYTEWGGRLSPDEHAIAYISNESGRWEVYLQPFPGTGVRRQVSQEGGVEVVWGRNGRELFYRNGQRLMVAKVTTSPLVSVEAPQLLFEGPYLLVSPGGHGYDVTADDQRFVMIQPGEDEIAASSTIRVRINWFDEIRRRAASSR